MVEECTVIHRTRLLAVLTISSVALLGTLGAYGMTKEQEDLCKHIAVATQKEFVHQFQTSRSHYKPSADRTYRADICFVLKANSTVTNNRLRCSSSETGFDQLALKAVQCAELPAIKSHEDIPIVVKFELDSGNVNEIKTKSKIDKVERGSSVHDW
jgi:hypothetical protein